LSTGGAYGLPRNLPVPHKLRRLRHPAGRPAQRVSTTEHNDDDDDGGGDDNDDDDDGDDAGDDDRHNDFNLPLPHKLRWLRHPAGRRAQRVSMTDPPVVMMMMAMMVMVMIMMTMTIMMRMTMMVMMMMITPMTQVEVDVCGGVRALDVRGHVV
jgi:hypothetical protein